MKGLNAVWLLAIGFFIYPAISYGQRAEAPLYKDGDWWRIKHEVSRVGFDVSGTCPQDYPEYIVKIVDGKPNVFGAKNDQQTAIKCPLIVGFVLGRQYLRFPLQVGLTWSETTSRQIPGRKPTPVDYKYEVSSWEKIRTPKGEFDAFKVVRSFVTSPAPRPPVAAGQPRWQTQTYYYAPSVKALVQYRAEEEGFTQTSTLVDFSLAQQESSLLWRAIKPRFRS